MTIIKLATTSASPICAFITLNQSKEGGEGGEEMKEEKKDRPFLFCDGPGTMAHSSISSILTLQWLHLVPIMVVCSRQQSK